MGSLFLSLAVVGLGLGVLFYVGTLFFQGYIYTEPSSGLLWQAPAAAGAIFLFLLLWCVIVANSATASPTDIPYDTLFRFSPKVDMVDQPAKELIAVTKKGDKVEKVTYRLRKNERGGHDYIDKKFFETTGKERYWNPDNVKEIHMKHGDQDLIFELTDTGAGANRHFVNRATGFTIVEYSAGATSGPNGIPSAFRWSRFLFVLFLNFLHFALWFVCLWLLLRYQWGHALGLAAVGWLLFTLAFMPMLLDEAGKVALAKRTPQPTKSAALRPDLTRHPIRFVSRQGTDMKRISSAGSEVFDL